MDREIEVHADPKPEPATYATKTVHRAGETIRLTLANQTLGEIRVDQILP
ncbi:MAG TPA: hypothetical protein PKB10_07100 [Tepidisphaeraceae bacterium]|nr:hypothetical protein [Tepidisphaeraceae bacterium]